MLRGLLALALLGPAAPGEPDRNTRDPRAADAEARVLRALAREDLTALAALAREIHVPDPTKRRNLPLRIRRDVVEFRFRGEFPADKLAKEMLEYVVADAAKDYEALLVAGAGELERLGKLGEALDAWHGRGRPPALTVRLTWAEGGRTHVKDLAEILALEPPARRQEFVRQLEFNRAGLGGTLNLKADPKALPVKRVPAEVVIGVRLPRALP